MKLGRGSSYKKFNLVMKLINLRIEIYASEMTGNETEERLERKVDQNLGYETCRKNLNVKLGRKT